MADVTAGTVTPIRTATNTVPRGDQVVGGTNPPVVARHRSRREDRLRRQHPRGHGDPDPYRHQQPRSRRSRSATRPRGLSPSPRMGRSPTSPADSDTVTPIRTATNTTLDPSALKAAWRPSSSPVEAGQPGPWVAGGLGWPRSRPQARAPHAPPGPRPGPRPSRAAPGPRGLRCPWPRAGYLHSPAGGGGSRAPGDPGPVRGDAGQADPGQRPDSWAARGGLGPAGSRDGPCQPRPHWPLADAGAGDGEPLDGGDVPAGGGRDRDHLAGQGVEAHAGRPRAASTSPGRPAAVGAHGTCANGCAP